MITDTVRTRDVDFHFGVPFRTPLALLAVGGRRPSPEWTADLLSRGSYRCVGVDAGTAVLRAAGVVPAEVLGDMDSAAADDIEWAVERGASRTLYDPVKDLTDFQLALSRTDSGAAVIGCFGGRFDHLLSIADELASSERHIGSPRLMLDDAEMMTFVTDGSVDLVFRRRPLAVSLMSMSEKCIGISITGTKWRLERAALTRASHWAISNELSPDADTVSARVERGTLAVYCCM